MGLTRLAIRRPLTVLMGILALVLMGAVSYTYLQVDRLPPVSIGVVSVSVTWPNASAENVERLVAEPLENAISGISGIDTITSNSSEGTCSVFVQLVDGYDPNQADIDIQQAMGPVLRQLPTGATAPVVRKFDPNASPILNLAFTGAPLDQLYDIASNQIQPELASVPGVGQVNISGGLQREIQVQIDYTRLAAYGVTVAQVSQALTSANISVPAGSVPVGTENFNVLPGGLFQNVHDIQNVVISNTPTGGSVTVGNVATVKEGDKTQYSLQRLNGQEAVGLSITANSDANTVAVADAVQAELAHLEQLLPQGTHTSVVEDQSVFTRASLDAIQRDLGIAIIMVGLVILVFLHDWKHTAIVLCAIPTSLISTFLVMYLLHFTLNTMSMMALALMIGILVDDSIVVLENIHRHLQLGENPVSAALTGRSEIGLAALAITACDVVVYTPVAFMSGSVGQLFRQYGLTVTTATIFSMLMSFTLTPMLASRWLRHSDKPSRFRRLSAFGRAWDRGFARVSTFFANSVAVTLRVRWLVLLIATALVAIAFSLVPLRVIGTEYAPAEDDNEFEVNLQLPPGTSLTATDAAARQAEAYLQQMPEVKDFFTTVSIPGGNRGGFGGGASSVNIQATTIDKNQRKRTVFDLLNVMRAQTRNIAGASFSGNVTSPLPGGGGGFGIQVTISGPDLNTVNQIASETQNTLLRVPGVQDIRNSQLSQVPQLNIQLDAQRMAELGISNQTVDTALSTAIGGTVVTEFQPPGAEQEDITLEGPDAARYNLTTLGQIPVGSTNGGASVVTLGQVATISQGSGPVSIQRVNRADTVTLSASAVGRPLGDVSQDMYKALNTVSMPAGYSYALRGSVQIFNQAITALAAALVLSIVLEYMLLVALYESWLLPFVRMLTVPLGLLGGLTMLLVTGNTINIFSIIGMIMGEGLVAKSGILLIDYTKTLQERGIGRTEALQEAVRVRLRPILMTSCTMIFGMLPLALKLEPGAETRAPMALVVIGALLSSTLLTLIVVPALYTLLDDLQTRVFGRKRRDFEAVQPVAAVGAEPAPGEPVAAGQSDGHGGPPAGDGHDGAAHGNGRDSVPLNVVESSDSYVIRAAMPGIRLEDVDVSIHGHTLTISAERHVDGERDGVRYLVHEYETGRWQRTMALPQEVDGADVRASYENGILEVRLPKAAPGAARKVPIDGSLTG
ncbi:MAG: efflux RND transporter permease subunit [Chloroflexi bacterium]|nr:efflux RND transporter permease subunit [Chloroflexota bacterium]